MEDSSVIEKNKQIVAAAKAVESESRHLPVD
jgi:hypothetical protein